MERTRSAIQTEIKETEAKIIAAHEEILNLERENALFCDEDQWFEEKMETVSRRENRKKVSEEKLMGRVYWKQGFKDEDTGQVVTIERSRLVRVDGEWI